MKFHVADYKIRKNLSLDRYDEALPDKGWSPDTDRGKDLGKRLPVGWSEFYYTLYPGRYEPAIVYQNFIRIANYIAANPDKRAACLKLEEELLELTYETLTERDGMKFVASDYEHDRFDHVMAPGWVSSIQNALVLRGLCRMQDVCPNKPRRKLIRELAGAYRIINSARRRLDRPWFSWVDADGYIWFDEYPTDASEPSRVLNGHIHAVYGLYYARRHLRWKWVERFLQGGLATLRAKTHCFQVTNNINRYDLRPGYKPDYNPERTIRQQRELARLTGDPYFDEMADIFARDLAETDARRGDRKRGRTRVKEPPY